MPWSKAANEDGTFKSDDELTALYGEAGLDGSKPTIAYCRIGERSPHTWVVLHELLGHRDVKNYNGSWAEYGSLIGANRTRSGLLTFGGIAPAAGLSQHSDGAAAASARRPAAEPQLGGSHHRGTGSRVSTVCGPDFPARPNGGQSQPTSAARGLARSAGGHHQ